MLLNKVTEMSLNEKFQAVFTWNLKKPTFEVVENATPKEELNYEMPNCIMISEESRENAKTLLIPAIEYLATIIQCEKNNVGGDVVEKLKGQFKKSFTFALEHKTLLYP